MVAPPTPALLRASLTALTFSADIIASTRFMARCN
jgi:hypothetical protein